MLVNVHIPKRLILFALMTVGLAQELRAQVWTLQQCLDTAREKNKNIMINKNNALISKQRFREAQGGLMPKINLNADYRYYTNLPYQLMPKSIFDGPEGQFNEVQFGVPHNINANVQVTMPLVNAQVNGAIRTTKIAMDISELQKQQTEEQVYFEVSNAYYNAQILSHQRAFIESNLKNTKTLLSSMQLLKEHLLAKSTDVDKVALQAEQLTTQKYVAESKYDLVINSLKFLIGVPLETNLQIESEIDYGHDAQYADQTILDIRLARSQYQLLESEISTFKNARLPTVSLFGTFGTTGFGYDKSPNGFLHFHPIGLAGIQFSYPLFNGFSTRRKINQKNLELSNTELQIQLLTTQNKIQIENARKQKVIAQRTLETTFSQIELAQSIYDQTLVQQKEGTASLTDTLSADNSVREAQQTYLTTIIDYLKADLELKKLTGNILSK
ncbi:MAG TPA: TolC family protein [Chryseosolibacter sp.]